MAQTTADFVIARLREWGVRRIYGYPGDGINGLMAALRKVAPDEQGDGEGPRFIQARHEELAAFMACAHAKFTGVVGVCLATSGPGAIHLLNGLYDAKMDHQPVVAIVGQSATTAIGGAYQQEVDLHALFKDVASEFITTVSHPAAARHAIDRAVRIALDQRAVTCVIMPKDVQEEPAVPVPPRAHDTIHSGVGYSVPHVVPKRADLEAAAKVLNEAERVAMLVGAGALNSADEVMRIAELLGAGVAKAWLGKAVLPDDVPYCTGTIGLLGTKPTWEMMQNADALLMVGSSFPYSEFLPPEGQAKAVQIDLDGRMLSLRYPMTVNLKGDAKETLAALIPLIERKRDQAWQNKLIEQVTEWWATCDAEANTTADPIHPAKVFAELSTRLPDDAILAADSGTAAFWYARHVRVRRGMMATGSGNLASMGNALPYALAAKFCHPGRVAVALVGDGAMQMNGLNVMITAAKYYKEWADPRLICLVLNNCDLNMVTWEQRIMTGDVKFNASQELPEFSYARYADQLGLTGIRVENPEQVGPAWAQALAADRPVILDVVTDPAVPPMPPHISLKQAKNFASAILKRDPEAGGVVAQAVKSVVNRILPGGE
ncbi:MAG: thiamine pyrophosphate-requiring protein [Phycisphaerae bacterium]